MEVDEIQKQAFKFQRIGSSNGHGANNIGHPDEEEGRVVLKRSSGGGGGGGNGMDILGGGIGVARLCGWPSSSRIVRVSRASGGKDRHSKVLTSKGLRDRRVRLSVSTAIQFYDLQDRLGYEQPSKAVEWLIKAASSSIAELPSLNPAFSGTGQQVSDERKSREITERGFESGEVELDGDPNFQHQQQGHSSTSETSKGSGLSLSRSENRIKARERARERAAEKEKERDNDSHCPISQNPSFTDLLSAGIKNNSNNYPNGLGHQNSGGSELDLVNKEQSQWTTSMDCLFGPTSSRGGQTSSGFLRHMNSLEPFTTTRDHHHHHQPEVQHFSFVQENLVPVATTAGESLSYNLNFSMSSSGLAGFNRGTLQSNSSPSISHPPHIQRLNSIDGSNINMSFFNGSTASASNVTVAPVENHHHHHQFPAGFKLCYGETPSGRHSDNYKGKAKH